MENCSHRSFMKKKTSQYVGVSFDATRQKWVSGIYFNNVSHKFGRFETEHEAHIARKTFEEKNGIINRYS